MKINSSLATLSLIAFSSVAAHAGPPPEFFARFTKPVKPAPAIVQAPPVASMPCDLCQTESIREPRYRAPMSKGMPDMVVVGTQHRCARCEGAITVLKGKVDDRMQRSCPTCRETACCVPSVAAQL